jgi:small-conductance mechanosensitive channel
VDELAQYNKDLSSKLETRAFAAEKVEEEVRALRLVLNETDEELKRTKAEWKETESLLREQLDTERHILDETLTDLEATQTKLDALTQDAIYIPELEKENTQLKDKVCRQEAFLKRKLEKEKNLRGAKLEKEKNPRGARLTVQTCKKPPGRARLVRKSLPSPHSVGGLTETTVECSLDWELDSLLAD